MSIESTTDAAERAKIAAAATKPVQMSTLPDDVLWFLDQEGRRHQEWCLELSELCPQCVLIANYEEYDNAHSRAWELERREAQGTK